MQIRQVEQIHLAVVLPSLHHALDFGHVVHQHIFDPTLQRHARRRAPVARALQLHRHEPALGIERLEHDVSPVFRHRRSNPRLEEFLDHRHDFIVVLRDRRPARRQFLLVHHRLSARVKVRNRLKRLRFHRLPLRVFALRHRHEVDPEEDIRDAFDREQPLRQRARHRFPRV